MWDYVKYGFQNDPASYKRIIRIAKFSVNYYIETTWKYWHNNSFLLEEEKEINFIVDGSPTKVM